MLCCFKCQILLCLKTAISHIWTHHSALQVKIPESKFSNICFKLDIYNNYSLPKKLYNIDVLSRLDIFIMALIC